MFQSSVSVSESLESKKTQLSSVPCGRLGRGRCFGQKDLETSCPHPAFSFVSGASDVSGLGV